MTTTALAARPGTADDAVRGVVPGEVVRPTSTDEVVEAVRGSATDGAAGSATGGSPDGGGRTVLAAGGRSKLDWAPAPTSVDLLVDTTGLDRVVEHVPGDLIVVAEAGVRLDVLQEQLAGAGQWLALDPPEPGATLGGVLSANASGPRRLRYGTVRDLLIGITVVLADGTVAHAGGKVVKNVAGYDLGKLYTGAHGTLGVVVSTTWRLHPVAPARRVVVLDLASPADAGPLALRLAASTLTPSAVELLVDDSSGGGTARLVVVFEAIAESVAAQADAAQALLGGGQQSDDLPDGFGARPVGDLVLRLAFAPASLAAVLGLLPDGARVAASACTGVAYAALPAGSCTSADIAALRSGLAAHDGTAVVLAGQTDDHWGPVGDALPLMQRVKDRFDPERRLAPGRFVGGL